MSTSSSISTADLNRQVHAVGDEVAKLASAAETPPPSDQLLAQAWDRLRRLGEVLRLQSEELALERRRSAELRAGERYDYLPLKYVPNLPRRLTTLLSACTALDPEQRPGAPGAVVLDFEGLVLDTAPGPDDFDPDADSDPGTRPPVA